MNEEIKLYEQIRDRGCDLLVVSVTNDIGHWNTSAPLEGLAAASEVRSNKSLVSRRWGETIGDPT